jgi:hypothetical protein
MGVHVSRNPVLVANIKGLDPHGPGSNGFWRRDIYRKPGTYTWTASKDGKVKIQALGAGAGANGLLPGASGSFGEKTLSVTVGQTLTVVVGPGGTAQRNSINSLSGNGGATSISGVPVGGTALVLVGALGTSGESVTVTQPGVAGVATGPWDKSNPGAVGIYNGGAPSSGSPSNPGFSSTGSGGAGWGGGAIGIGGGSSHRRGVSGTGAPGLVAQPALDLNGSPYPGGQAVNAFPFWDFADVDGAGGSSFIVNGGGTRYSNGGPGAGGSGGVATPGGIGGGSGTGNTSNVTEASNGSGGPGNNTAAYAGDGGNAFVMIFWDEVAA